MNSEQKSHSKLNSDKLIEKINSEQKHLLRIIDNPKRGTSLKAVRTPNENNLTSNENRRVLLSKVITQIDHESNYKQHAITSPQFPRQKHLLEFLPTYLPPKRVNKKTLVLDLDETLVHSSFNTFQCPSDVVIKIDVENQIQNIHVLLRPNLDDFLRRMAEKFELIVFTASLSKYADLLINILDKRKEFAYRLFREHCTALNRFYTKDLKKLNRDLSEIVILDNSSVSYALNRNNGVPIVSWFGDKTDCELINLIPVLEFLAIVPDVRNYIPQLLINNEISYTKAKEEIHKYMQSDQSEPVQVSAPAQAPVQPNIIIVDNYQYEKTNPSQNITKHKKKHHGIDMRNKRRLLSPSNDDDYIDNKANRCIDLKLKLTNHPSSFKPIINDVIFHTSKEAMPLIMTSKHALLSNDQKLITKLSNNNQNSLRMKQTQKIMNGSYDDNKNNNDDVYDLLSTTNFSRNLKQHNKQKQVDSFTFRKNQYSFQSGINIRKNNASTNHKNRQISLKAHYKNNEETQIETSKICASKRNKNTSATPTYEPSLKHYFAHIAKPSHTMRLINRNKVNDFIKELSMNQTANKIYLKETNKEFSNNSNNNRDNSESNDIEDTLKKKEKSLELNNNNSIKNKGMKFSIHIKPYKKKK